MIRSWSRAHRRMAARTLRNVMGVNESWLVFSIEMVIYYVGGEVGSQLRYAPREYGVRILGTMLPQC